MDIIIELAKLLIPAVVVLYGMYLTVKSFLNKEFEKKVVDLRMKNSETVLPVRLQAYERMCLFLERIAPNNLILRLNDSSYSAKQLQQILLADIREEFNHNLSQQLYMGDESWRQVKYAKEEIATIINRAAEDLPKDAKGIDLAKKIFEQMQNSDKDPITDALTHVKNEIRQVF